MTSVGIHGCKGSYYETQHNKQSSEDCYQQNQLIATVNSFSHLISHHIPPFIKIQFIHNLISVGH